VTLHTPVPVLLLSQMLDAGGSERQLCEIARTLDRERFEPHVGTMRPSGFRAVELAAAGVPVTVFPLGSFLSAGLLREALRLRQYTRRHGIRLVHAFDTPMNMFAVPAARAFGVPVVLASQRSHRGLVPGASRYLLRLADRIADAVVVNCRAVERHLVEEEHTPRESIRLCYNGVDTTLFRPGPRGDHPLRVGTLCVLREEKGVDVLLRGFARVRCSRPVELVIAGDGPMRAEMEMLARSLGIAERVRFVGATAEVVQALQAMDVFVLPSRSEALSNSLMEAMACGCCAIASNVGGNPELVRTGMLFESGDPASLAAMLDLVLENNELRQRLAREGMESIQANFSIESAARAMSAIYESFL